MTQDKSTKNAASEVMTPLHISPINYWHRFLYNCPCLESIIRQKARDKFMVPKPPFQNKIIINEFKHAMSNEYEGDK